MSKVIDANLYWFPEELFTDDNLAEKMLAFIISNWEHKDPENVTTLDHLLSSLLSCFYLDQLRYDRRDDGDSHHIDTSTYNPVTRSIIAFEMPMALMG